MSGALGRRGFFVRSTVVAFWGHALPPFSKDHLVAKLHCVGLQPFGEREGLLAASGNLVALRVLPTLQNGVSVLGSRWGGQPVVRSLCARSPGCFCLRLDFQVAVSVRGGSRESTLGS